MRNLFPFFHVGTVWQHKWEMTLPSCGFMLESKLGYAWTKFFEILKKLVPSLEKNNLMCLRAEILGACFVPQVSRVGV